MIQTVIKRMNECVHMSYAWYGCLNHATQINNELCVASGNEKMLFVDDERFPSGEYGSMYIVRRNDQLVKYLDSYGVPKCIYWDNDLGYYGEAKTLIDTLTNFIIDGNIKLPTGFSYYVHSQNPVERDSINSKMEQIIKHFSS